MDRQGALWAEREAALQRRMLEAAAVLQEGRAQVQGPRGWSAAAVALRRTPPSQEVVARMRGFEPQGVLLGAASTTHSDPREMKAPWHRGYMGPLRWPTQ